MELHVVAGRHSNVQHQFPTLVYLLIALACQSVIASTTGSGLVIEMDVLGDEEHGRQPEGDEELELEVLGQVSPSDFEHLAIREQDLLRMAQHSQSAAGEDIGQPSKQWLPQPAQRQLSRKLLGNPHHLGRLLKSSRGPSRRPITFRPGPAQGHAPRMPEAPPLQNKRSIE